MSIATQISALQADKTAIRNAILAKGGTSAEGNGFDDFATDIGTISGGSSEMTIDWGYSGPLPIFYGTTFTPAIVNFNATNNASNRSFICFIQQATLDKLNLTIANATTAGFEQFADRTNVTEINFTIPACTGTAKKCFITVPVWRR